MCIICIQLQKDLLTIPEAKRNLSEMAESLGEHASEVDKIIAVKELDKMIDDLIEGTDYWVTD
jgi:hypothetical protein